MIVHIPDEIVPQLQAAGGDLSRQALEALALEAYRNDRITKKQLREMLGFETRYELDGFLKDRGSGDEYTWEDLERDRETLNRLGF